MRLVNERSRCETRVKKTHRDSHKNKQNIRHHSDVAVVCKSTSQHFKLHINVLSSYDDEICLNHHHLFKTRMKLSTTIGCFPDATFLQKWLTISLTVCSKSKLILSGFRRCRSLIFILVFLQDRSLLCPSLPKRSDKRRSFWKGHKKPCQLLLLMQLEKKTALQSLKIEKTIQLNQMKNLRRHSGRFQWIDLTLKGKLRMNGHKEK
ncbi:CLUMA_CG021059, isoform A [Clunio marinus]|uniref:CLUMA_CG021059, isoform A n=1 Tax=Clunio marinus TaxID=568069 RepID=A0A1J1J672_9DIPT|nr:CLUMA_CG021059, isoform A [Clunio marinus]